MSRAAGARSTQALWSFQLSRILGYSFLGAFAAGSVQGLALIGTHSIAIRPVWTMFHVAVLVLGVLLIWQARQPAWIDGLGQTVWRKTRPALTRLGPRAPVALGVAWALMPCGLLYSALLVASLSANVFEGTAIMALFALGTSVSLTVAPWLLLRLRGGRSGSLTIRLAGLALALTSAWALWMGVIQPTGLFCL